MKRIMFLLVLVLTMMLLNGCLPGDGRNTPEQPAGFFWGIWHGWVAPLSLIISLFNHEIHIFEIANNGRWYEFGFYAAVISGFGGFSLLRKKGS